MKVRVFNHGKVPMYCVTFFDSNWDEIEPQRKGKRLWTCDDLCVMIARWCLQQVGATMDFEIEPGVWSSQLFELGVRLDCAPCGTPMLPGERMAS